MRDWLKHKNWAVALWLLVIILIGVNVVVGEHLAATSDNRLQITILDVGQGDSMLIRSPDGKYGLIDGGRGHSVISQLAQFLPPLSRHFDFVIATHPDADHIEGLINVIQDYDVAEVLWESNQKSNSIITALQTAIKDKQIPLYELNSDNDFKLGCCVDFDVIWPTPDFDAKSQTESNAVSLTVIVKYGKFQMFAGGDLPTEQEELAINSLPENLRRVDVLKVSHHGSKNSSSINFLHELDAQIGLISVGKGNSYGHPTSQVLDNLKSAGVEVFRTDEGGPIQLFTDGNQLQVKTTNRLENLDLKD